MVGTPCPAWPFTWVGGAFFVRRPLHQSSADHLADLGHYGVPEGSDSVHPSGKPINHSTHLGFSCPGVPASDIGCAPARCTAVASLSPHGEPVLGGGRSSGCAPLASLAVGVGQVLAASRSPGFPLLYLVAPPVGVGQCPVRAIVSNDGRPRLSTLFPVPLPLLP
jgi:hypothetical protein